MSDRCISACREKERLGIRHGWCWTCVQELMQQFRTDIDAATKSLDTLRDTLHVSGLLESRGVVEALETYLEWNGPEHDEDCPADDTCACSLKWVNDGVNEACRVLRRIGRMATS